MAIECPKCQAENTPDSQFCKKCATSLTGGDGPFVSQTRTLQTPPERLTRGTRFADRYEVIEKLGEGGMGAVYRVEDTKVKEEVALKLINPLVASDKRTIERFRNELKFARKIRHKHVCQMFDLGEDEGTHYITMEYVAGEDLKSFLRRSGKLTIEMAVRVAKQVCEGLGEAHRLGIVHRDLKPSNVMIDQDGQARIMDFGIARSLKAKGITGAGLVIGTPEYMSPEQAEGNEVDLRSDIYSLGVILFEILTGQRPFEGDSALGIAMKHKGEEPQEPRLLNPNIPEAVNGLVLKCLKKNPADRYQNTEEILAELDALDLKSTETKPGERQKTKSTSKEITVSFNPRKLMVPGAVLILAIAAVLFVFWPRDQEKPPATSSGKPTLAILDFMNFSGDKEIDWLERAFPEYLMADLDQSKYVNVLDTVKKSSLLQELNLAESKNISEADLKTIGKRGNASYIITGRFLKSETGHAVITTLRRADTMEIVASGEVEGNLILDFTDLSDQMTVKIKNILGFTESQLADDFDMDIGDIRPKSKEAFEAFTQGYKAHMIDSDMIKAIEFYEKTLKLEPDFGYALVCLAVANFNMGKSLESKKFAEEAKKYKGRMTVREWNYANAYLNINSEVTIDTAFKAFQEILKDYPDEFDANSDSGFFNFFLEEYDETIKFNSNLLGRKNSWIPYKYLAMAYSAKGLYEKAEECLIYYLDNVEEHNEWIRAELALVQLCRGDYNRALLEIEKSQKSDPNLLYLYATGRLRYCQEDFVGAERAFEDLKQSQNVWMQNNSYNELHNTLLAQGRFKEARTHLENGIEVSESNASEGFTYLLYCALMYNYIQEGRAEEAIKAFERSWDVAQKAGFFTETCKRRLMNIKGIAVLELGDLEEANKIKAALKDLIDSGKNKKAIRLFYHLSGLIEERNGNLDLALRYFSDALELAPAEHDYEFILRLDRALYLEAIGRIYLKIGELDKAVERFEKIQGLTLGRLDYGNIYAKSYYMLGKIFEQKGWQGKAIESYKKFLDLWKNADPGITEVEDAKERLAVLLTS